IIYITLMVRRIRNSGYSLFILGVLLFPIILSTIAWMVYLVLIRQLTLALWFSPLFMITITQILFSIALGIPGVFQIWMMVVPSKAESL
ncbi:MAG: hypothetical protein PF447_05495, partial [Spirochaetaceae bacterium]|nr:hypothetical protein [Spirochaetaceae bacterium]